MEKHEIIAEYFKEETTGTALAKTVELIANAFGSEKTAKETAEYICTKVHRTLQQSIMRFVLIFLRRMADKNMSCDARNEASVKAARIMVQAYDDNKLNLPFI